MAPTTISQTIVPAPAPAAKDGGQARDLVPLTDVKLELGITDQANDLVPGHHTRSMSAVCARVPIALRSRRRFS
jgi:hypothetical protein